MPATNNATLTSIALHCIKIALYFQIFVFTLWEARIFYALFFGKCVVIFTPLLLITTVLQIGIYRSCFHSDFNKLYIQASTTPLLLQSAWRRVPSYLNPHFCITIPEFGLFGSCCDSILFTPTSSKKKGIIALNASVVNPWCHHLLPIQYPM